MVSNISPPISVANMSYFFDDRLRHLVFSAIIITFFACEKLYLKTSGHANINIYQCIFWGFKIFANRCIFNN